MNVTRLFTLMALLCFFHQQVFSSNNVSAKALTVKEEAAQQPETSVLKGKVTDEKGEPLIGVSVYVDGTTIGVTSDVNGNYQLSFLSGENALVNYSFLGMKTETYVFTGKNTVKNIILKEDSKLLEDIVVIGYGTKDKKSLTSSISSMSKAEIEKLAPTTSSLDNMLGGAIKGVQMNQTSGEPGATTTIKVRGITSPYPNMITGQNSNIPLYVIDGVPLFVENNTINPLLSLSPSDIESIDVLKDASATAIYGSRGANGVIIVKTKNGRKGEKISIEAGYTFSVGNPVKEFTPLNTAEFKEHQNLILKNTVAAMNTFKSYASSYELGALGIINEDFDWDTFMPIYTYGGLRQEAFGTANTNWVKEIKNKNAQTNQYNLSARGGSEKINYSFSFNATEQDGLLINDKFTHYGARTSFDSEITNRIKFGSTLNYSYSKRKSPSMMEGFMDSYSTWLIRPDQPVYDENGLFQRLDGSTLFYGLENQMANPVALRQKESIFQSYQFIGNAYIDVELLKGLRFHSDINLANYKFSNDYFTPLVSIDKNMAMPFLSTLSTSDSETFTSSINFRLDYGLIVGKHNFTAMAGMGFDRTTSKSKSFDFEGFPSDEYMHNLGAAKSMTSYGDSYLLSGLNSIYSRLSYDYDARYLAEVAFRGDESSKFGPNNKWGTFPALSLGWRINKENFLKEVKAIDDLKLRLSTGKTGSTNVADFSYRQYYERRYNDMYGGNISVRLRDLLPNEGVKWEMTTEYNAGLDFSFFDHRLYGSLDVYYRYTDGALAPAPHILESGINSYYANIIDMSNRGYEFEIGGDIIRQKNFIWNASLNISSNKNKIEKLNSATIMSGMQDAFIEGKPAGTIKGYKVKGIIQNQEEIDNLNLAAQDAGYDCYQEFDTGVGDYLFEDTNGDGRITTADRGVIANPEPKFFGGFTNTFTYKQFSLSFLMQFSQGGQAMWDTLIQDMYATVGLGCSREVFRNTWTPENTDARYPQLVNSNMAYMNGVYSDRFVFSTSYLRMKNITLSYAFPKSLYSKWKLNDASLFASVSNLFTVTNWPGIDPELIGTGTTLMGLNRDPYPLSKTFSLGVKFNF